MSVLLDTHERQHGIVLKLAAYLEQRLADQRAKNDNDLTPEETAALRGRIAEVKHLQDLLASGES